MQKVSGYQLSLMGVALVSVLTLVNTPSQVMFFARQHVYLSYIFSALTLFLFVWMSGKVASRFPKQDLFHSITDRLPLIGRGLISAYLIFFLIILVRDLRILTDFVNIFLLQETPLLVISSLFIIPVIFMVRSGIEVIGRMTEVYMIIFLFVIIFIPILMLKDVNPTFFMPITDVHWRGVGIGWWYVISYMGEIMILPFLSSGYTYSSKYGILSLGIGTAVLVIVTIFELLVLGVQITPRTMFPTYNLVREINITDFLDRFEIILVALYLPSTIIRMGYMLYLLCYGFTHVTPKVSTKLLSAPIGVLAMIVSYWLYDDLIQVVQLNAIWPFFALVFEIVLPTLFFFFLFPKKKKIEKKHKEKECKA